MVLDEDIAKVNEITYYLTRGRVKLRTFERSNKMD